MGKRILVVDDSPDAINIISHILKVLEPRIVADYAYTSTEAIGFIAKQEYNAMILDVSLPDFTGFYLGNLIREKCHEVPIAFLTNYDGEVTKDNADFIEAKMWAKPLLFGNPLLLRSLVAELCAENPCKSMQLTLPKYIDE